MKTIFKEGIIVSITDYFVYGVSFLITLLINNFYGIEELGFYTLILAIAQIIILSFNGSYSAIIRRDLSIEPLNISKYTNNIVTLRLLATVVLSFVPMFLTITQLQIDKKKMILFGILLLSKGLESVNETFLTTYQTIGFIKAFSVFKFLQAFLILISILFLGYIKTSIIFIYSIPVLVYLLFLLVHIFFTNSKIYLFKFTLDLDFITYIRKEGWPLFISVIVGQLNIRGSILIISRFVTASDLGIYSIGVTLVSLATSFINSLIIVLFPTLTKKFNIEPRLAFLAFKKISIYSFFLGIAIFVLFNLFFSLIPLVYQNLPTEKFFYIRVMSSAIIPIVAMGISSYMFPIIGMQKQGMQLMIFLMIINLVIFTISTYYFDFLGACIAYVITLTVTFLSFFLKINHIFKKIYLKKV